MCAGLGGSSSVGFDYYSKLIRKFVSKTPSSSVVLPELLPEVFLGKSFFSIKYIQNDVDRISLYKKLSSCVDLDSFFLLKSFIISKFGAPCSFSSLLFDSKEISLLLVGSEVERVVCSEFFVEVFFSKMYGGGFDVLVKLLDVFFKEISLSYTFIKKDVGVGFSFKKTDAFVLNLKSLFGVLYE